MECFKGCSSVTEIPEELFANNVDTAIFIGCFSECISLRKIPEGLLKIILT